jgi:ubiquinone/menaquinone biosynthesis C-methylase UbiE
MSEKALRGQDSSSPGVFRRRFRGGVGLARRGARRLLWALEDRRLIAEEESGVLGPAHLRWRDHSAAQNRSRWSDWDWSARGEEWNASGEWKHALIEDVLKRWIPVGVTVLEIGPGAGRFTEALAPRAARLILVDVSARPLDLCRQRFADANNISYVLSSSGTDLPTVADRSVDAIWSFDVFVHIAPRDQAAYLAEVARVLAPGGVAVIHHADGRNRGVSPSRNGWRAPMSRKLFAALATQRNLDVESQLDSWGPDGRYDLSGHGDAITVLRQRDSPRRSSSDKSRPVA